MVLQSSSLRTKDVGYVNKEIDLALERQRYYRPPRIFVIPAIVDDPANQIDQLGAFQYIDLSAGDGVTQLVHAIRRDLDLAGRRQ